MALNNLNQRALNAAFMMRTFGLSLLLCLSLSTMAQAWQSTPVDSAAYYRQQVADRDEALRLLIAAQAALETDATLALRLMEAALQKADIPPIRKVATEMYRDHLFMAVDLGGIAPDIDRVYPRPHADEVVLLTKSQQAYLVDWKGSVLDRFDEAFSSKITTFSWSSWDYNIKMVSPTVSLLGVFITML